MSKYLVIGASSGIGQKVAEELVLNGHEVYGTYNKNDNFINESISYHSLNVLDDYLNFDFIPDSLDGLVYCPGSINLKPFERIKPSDFLEDYQLQVLGAIKCIQGVIQKLKNGNNSSVILFSTVAVSKGLPFHSQVSSSKGAIEGLTKALSAEYAPKIRINCVAPSLTNTPLAAALLNNEQKREANAQRHPLKRVGTVDDIANATTFLLSEKSSWITGQIFHVDGGISVI